MPAWRPLAGLIRSLSTLWGVTRHSRAARGFHPQTGTGLCPPTLGWRSVGMLADQLDYVVGVDPHRDTHAVGVVMSSAAWSCSRRPSPRRVGGYAEALRLADAARAGSACVRGRGNRLLRCRSDALPDRAAASGCSRSAGCGGSAAQAARPTRSTRSAPPGACSAGAACDASGRRRTSGAAGVDGRTGRSGQRQVRRTLPAARSADHDT